MAQVVGHEFAFTCPLTRPPDRFCTLELNCKLRMQPTNCSRVLIPLWLSVKDKPNILQLNFIKTVKHPHFKIKLKGLYLVRDD